MHFISPTKGVLSFEGMFEDIMGYVTEAPQGAYRLIIGSDSHSRDDLCFVTAVIIHRVGKGARYYYRRSRRRLITSLRQKIYYETSLSLGVGSQLAERLSSNGAPHLDLNVEIHIDVGQKGETKDLIREIVGMVTGSGFDAKIKPDSYGASKVADKHTK
jgi:predicted RNase H-related nuclease YkuK (DUF458 family)